MAPKAGRRYVPGVHGVVQGSGALIALSNREIRALLRMFEAAGPVSRKTFPKGVGGGALEALVATGLATSVGDGRGGYAITAEGVEAVEAGRYARRSTA